MAERMNESVNESINETVNESTDEWINEWINKWIMYQSMNQSMKKSINEKEKLPYNDEIWQINAVKNYNLDSILIRLFFQLLLSFRPNCVPFVHNPCTTIFLSICRAKPLVH